MYSLPTSLHFSFCKVQSWSVVLASFICRLYLTVHSVVLQSCLQAVTLQCFSVLPFLFLALFLEPRGGSRILRSSALFSFTVFYGKGRVKTETHSPGLPGSTLWLLFTFTFALGLKLGCQLFGVFLFSWEIPWLHIPVLWNKFILGCSTGCSIV